MRTTPAAAGLLVVSALAACGPVDQAGSAQPVKTVTAAPTTAPRAAGTPKHTAAAAKPTTPKLIRVPRVVGHNHQAAQNEMQAAGLFMLHEQDATGQGRLLLWDRNWVVVRQTPAAGKKVGPDTTITLYSKKIGE